MTWVGFGATDVGIIDPRQSLRWYHATEASRDFCACCGSPMFFKSPRFPGELHMARALFHEELAQQPQAQAFFSSHVRWATLAEVLPVVPEPEWSQHPPGPPD